MKKILACMLILSMMLAFAACGDTTSGNQVTTAGNTPGENTADNGTSGSPDGSDGPAQDTTDAQTEPPAPDYLQFAVTEGDFGDLFRNDNNWIGDKTIHDQTMSVKNSGSEESAVEWAGVCAGKSFEYETKLRVNSFGGGYVKIYFETETNLLSMTVYEDKYVIADASGSDVTVNSANDSDWHIYRFSVADNSASVYADGVYVGKVSLPEKSSSGVLAFYSKPGSSDISFDVDYVKVKTTSEDWVLPSLRMSNVSEWTYEENFDGDTIPEGWAQDGGVEGSASVSGGDFILTTSNKGEFIYKYTGDDVYKCNSYVFEIRLKADFCDAANSRISIFCFAGNNWRLHSQFKETSYYVQNPADASTTWASGGVDGADGEYHVIRCEVKVADDGAECKVFIDGAYSFTAPMNNNNGAACIKLIAASTAEGDTCTAYVDYIKLAILG